MAVFSSSTKVGREVDEPRENETCRCGELGTRFKSLGWILPCMHSAWAPPTPERCATHYRHVRQHITLSASGSIYGDLRAKTDQFEKPRPVAHRLCERTVPVKFQFTYVVRHRPAVTTVDTFLQNIEYKSPALHGVVCSSRPKT